MSRLFRDSRSGAPSHEWIYSGATTAFTLTSGSPEVHTTSPEPKDGNINEGTMYRVIVLAQARFKVGVAATAGTSDAILAANVEYLIGVPAGENLSIHRDSADCTGTITACE
jgi:hypothetical protein